MKNFLFDIGNVLVDFNFQLLLDRISFESGKPSLSLTVRDLEMHESVEKGLVTDEEFVRYLNASKGLSWTLEKYIGIWAEMYTVNPVGRALFLDAQDRGIPVYTLSNIAGHHIDAIEMNEPGFFDGADGLFLSYQMGVRKPDPEIYRRVLDELGAEGDDCLFLDDLPENVAAARAAGIHAYRFIPENHAAIREAVSGFFC
jgi:putative hydrolase of the HAD superfamily